MEILQTIWSALTTENKMLTLIICSPLTFLEVYISTLLFTRILNIEANSKKILSYVLPFSVIALITIFLIPEPYNTFVNVIACPILVYLVFKTNILKSILAQVIPYVVFVLLGSIVLNIYTILSGIPTSSFVNIPIHKLTFSIIMYACAYCMYLFFKHCNINIKLVDKFGKTSSRVLLINFCIGIVAICIQSFLATFYNDYLPFYITLSSVLVLLVYFFISIYTLSRTNKLEITTESLEQEKLYNKTLTILYDNIRGFKHDFNNIVQAIGGYISTDNMEGLKDYYSDLLADCRKSNNLAILNPELINNPAIYSILTSKYHKAEELGITMNFDIFMDLETLNIKTYDLTRILGILLDNAIDACNKCDEKDIYITIRKDSKANRQLIIIENTYSNKTVDTERIFEKGYTSKLEDDGKNHGLGLWEVREILKKNNNLNLYTTKSMRIFTQQLEIYS